MTADAAAIPSDLWAQGGAMSAACAILGIEYRPREAQQQMAAIVTQALQRGHASPGSILPIESGTGTGKTLAYLVPCALSGARTGKRVMVSTHTVALGSQIVTKEGPIAQAMVHALTGKRPTIAHILGRRHFISPSRARAIASLLREKNPRGAEIDAYLTAANDAEAAIADVIEASSNGLSDGDLESILDRSIIGRIEGTLGVRLEHDDISLVSVSPSYEKSVHDLNRKIATQADMLIATHAYTAIELTRRRFFGSEDEPLEALVIDEADQWAQAAASASLIRITIAGLRRSITAVLEAAYGLAKTATLEESATGALNAVDRLEQHAPRGTGKIATVESNGIEIRELRKIASSISTISSLARRRRSNLASAADSLEEQRIAIGRFDTILCGSNSSYWSAQWKTSSILAAPRIELVGRAPGRILKSVWDRPGGREPMASTIILTSATLATPGFQPQARWRSIEIATGVDPAQHNVLSDLSTTIMPRNFGTLRFRFADPRAPVPWVNDKGEMDGSALLYAADIIAAARTEAGPDGRTLVLVPAYDDVRRLKPLVPECLAHEQDTPSWRVLDTYRDTPGCCLITPAAWTGVDLPGLIQCLVIARLPYPPLRQESETFVGVLAEMLGKLAQGIGRAIRSENDDATVWFADPRMPIPDCVTESTGLLPSEHANIAAIGAIPDRFRALFGKDPEAATIGCLVRAVEQATRSASTQHGARPSSRSPRRTRGSASITRMREAKQQ